MGRKRWTSFVASERTRGRVIRQLHEEENPGHRLRVEHDEDTLLIHLSDEDGPGWMTIAIDRATREFAVGRGRRQIDSAALAYDAVHRGRPRRGAGRPRRGGALARPSSRKVRTRPSNNQFLPCRGLHMVHTMCILRQWSRS